HLGSDPEIFFQLERASLSDRITVYSGSAGLVYGRCAPADLAAGEEVVMTRLALALLVTVSALAQRVEQLWPDGAPGAVGSEDRDKPAITIYLPAPEKSSGAAVVICPGGGYGGLSMEKEGSHIAEWLKARGVAGFVLKYRLGPRYRHPAPLDDAQRALRYVRA